MILFILPKFSGGGAERVVINILNALCKNGHSVGLLVFDNNGPLSFLVDKNVPVYSLGTSSLRKSMLYIIKNINDLNPKVIFSTFGYINIFIRSFLPPGLSIWVREANLPSISLQNNLWKRSMSFLYKIYYKKSDKVICSSKIMKNEFVRDFSVPKGIIEILPNPVDVQSIRALSTPLKKFNCGGVCYVASGRLTYQKGFDRLLEWFSEIDNIQSSLVILGDGNLKDSLKNKIELLNLQDRVKLIGFCKNPWQWYAGADVFLLPSRWEGMPNSVLESLACGTKVVATIESGGVEELSCFCDDNSVEVANGKEEYLDAMKRVTVHEKISLSSSLLPEIYKIENVIKNIEKWMLYV